LFEVKIDKRAMKRMENIIEEICRQEKERDEKCERRDKRSQVPVAHICNPSYSGGRDQEALSSKPARANSLRESMWKKPITKKGWFKV
jgi:hypothetical protein